MRLLIVSDAWTPQVNGVVTTLRATMAELEARGHHVATITPDLFLSVPCPTYSEIRLALPRPGVVGRMIELAEPEAIHIATEGPLGLIARRWCLRRGFAFTTAYHTQFPAYVARRSPIPESWVWRYVKWFHGAAAHVLASTRSIQDELRTHGIDRLRHWGRGVDRSLFNPTVTPHELIASLPRPIMLYVGRVAVEKNVEAFLTAAHPGTKVIVGDGPALPGLQRDHPDATFLGKLTGKTLASAYRAADVMVFPSLTDTFGLVMIEAMACGTPVAAYPVTGPRDVVCDKSGAMAERLEDAIAEALTRNRAEVAQAGAQHSWAAATDQFSEALVVCDRLTGRLPQLPKTVVAVTAGSAAP